MLKKFITAQSPMVYGVVVTRVTSGLIIASYGLEIFDAETMNGYARWLTDIRFPAPIIMAYIGKLSELVGGVFLAFGLMTRFASLSLIITMIVITFIMGEGNLRSESFFLLLLFLTFFFLGGGKWSLDHLLFAKKSEA